MYLLCAEVPGLQHLKYSSQQCSAGAPVGLGTCPHQVFAATLTLSQPWEGGQIIPPLYWCPHQVLKATGAPADQYTDY